MGMRSLKVWYVIDRYDGPHAGTEKQLWLLIREMAARGHDVRLFVFRPSPYTQQVQDFPCPIELCHVSKVLSLRTLLRMWRLRQRIRRERPDIVHTFFNDAAVLVPIWCKTAFTAVITSRRDMGFWYSKAILYGLRLANTCVSGIVCNSEAVARLVAEREHVRREKLVVINNALPRKDSLSVSIAPFSLPVLSPADVNICLVANIRPIKRIGDLVLAAAQVLQTCPQARFWIAGAIPDTPFARDLVDLPHRLGIQHRLTFLGTIEEPLQLVEQCQIGVLTSESEGLSNSIIEYMACGLPVVCTDVGGNPQLVRHDENGYLFAAGDISCLAAHLVNLTLNPLTRADMGKCSLGRLHMFSVDSVIAQHVALYASVRSPKHEHKVLDQ